MKKKNEMKNETKTIRMTDNENYLGADVYGSLTNDETVADVQEKFRDAAEQAAAEMGYTIEWVNPENIRYDDDDENEIAHEIFKRSVKIGW